MRVRTASVAAAREGRTIRFLAFGSESRPSPGRVFLVGFFILISGHRQATSSSTGRMRTPRTFPEYSPNRFEAKIHSSDTPNAGSGSNNADLIAVSNGIRSIRTE